MIELKDQMNTIIRFGNLPKRIISLVPSQTELLYDLGCDIEVIGITKFCIYPNHWYKEKTRVGGTKNVNFETIAALNPDLIIANKEENAQEDIEKLQKLYPVYISDIFNLTDACQMIMDVGTLTNKEENAIKLVDKVKIDFLNFPKFNGSVLYFIWSNPYMVVGPNTFIGTIIDLLGFTNKLNNSETRYQEITIQEIQKLNPDHLLLSSEPYPFKEKHIQEIKSFYKGEIHLVDGEMFSWYGSRMAKMKLYFEELNKKIYS